MMKAEIHPNAHMVKAGEDACISLKEMKKYARVRHVATAILSDVEFVVQPAGRKKALDEGVKNVHAWARGTLVGEFDKPMELADFEVPDSIKQRFREVSYNYEAGQFFDVETAEAIRSTARLTTVEPDLSPATVKTARTVYAVRGTYYYLPSK